MIAVGAVVGTILWLVVLLLPWRPWRTAERLEVSSPPDTGDLSDMTALIPARDEAESIVTVVEALRGQGAGLRIVVIDDGSTDGTAALARSAGAEVLTGAPLPEGWSGKLWALEQGRRAAATPLLLLVDADILLLPGTVAALRRRQGESVQMVSVMARLRMAGTWERLLLPAFVYFFKLLYPFRLANGPSRRFAAAAGGCILIESRCLKAIGGFGALRGAVIDDCTLARRVKAAGFRTWIGLTHAAVSLRRCPALADIWAMVARTAYPQLRRSPALLMVCTLVMAVAFWAPPAAAITLSGYPASIGAAGWAAMVLAYVPTLRYYRLSPLWAAAMPLIGTLYLAMTWTSAINHWRGRGNAWKGRRYGAAGRRLEAG